MNIAKLKTNIQSVTKENYWGRLIIALLTAVILLLGVRLFSEKTVIAMIPPNLNEASEQHFNMATAGIHKAWSLYVAESLGNVTPETAAFVRETLGPLLGPRIRDEALVLMDKQIDIIKRDKTSFSFEPREVQFDEATRTTYIMGRHFTHQAGSALPTRVNRTYEFRWAFSKYMPVLEFIDTYEGAPRLQN